MPSQEPKPRPSKQPAATLALRDEREAAPQPFTLIKGKHHWVFSCDPGDEAELLRCLSELASRPDVQFDWFDAALVSHQLSRRLKSGLARIDPATPQSVPPTAPGHAAA